LRKRNEATFSSEVKKGGLTSLSDRASSSVLKAGSSSRKFMGRARRTEELWHIGDDAQESLCEFILVRTWGGTVMMWKDNNMHRASAGAVPLWRK